MQENSLWSFVTVCYWIWSMYSSPIKYGDFPGLCYFTRGQALMMSNYLITTTGCTTRYDSSPWYQNNMITWGIMLLNPISVKFWTVHLDQSNLLNRYHSTQMLIDVSHTLEIRWNKYIIPIFVVLNNYKNFWSHVFNKR